MSRSARLRVFALANLTFYLLLAVSSARTRRPSSDEASWINPAVDLITNGSMGVTTVEPIDLSIHPGLVNPGIDRHIYVGVPFHFFVHAAWYRLFGFSVLTMRAVSILWGLTLVVSCGAILRLLGMPVQGALIGAGLTGVNHLFITAASDGRPDIGCAALGFAALALFLALRERHLSGAILGSHALLALSAATHPNALIYFFDVLLVTLWLDRHRLRLVHLLLPAIPYAAVFIPWAIDISRDPETFLGQLRFNASHRFNYLFSPWAAVRAEVVERYLEPVYLPPYATGFNRARILVALFYPLAVLGALSSRRVRAHRGYRILLALTALAFLSLAILQGQKSSYYLIHIVPFYTMLLGVWIFVAGLSRRTATVIVALYLLGNVGWTARNIRLDLYHSDYAPAMDYLRQRVTAGDLVYGPSEIAAHQA